MWRLPKISKTEFRLAIEKDLNLATYLARELLLHDGVKVHGLGRRISAILCIADSLAASNHEKLLTSGWYEVKKEKVSLRALRSLPDYVLSYAVKTSSLTDSLFTTGELVRIHRLVEELAVMSMSDIDSLVSDYVDVKLKDGSLLSDFDFHGKPSRRKLLTFEFDYCFCSMYLPSTSDDINTSFQGGTDEPSEVFNTDFSSVGLQTLPEDL